jgi:Flp pilus assembly protein TadB/predicted secreted protein
VRSPLRRAEALALLLITAALLMMQAPFAHADTAVGISSATTTDRAVDLVLDAQGLPSGAKLDDKAVSVTVDGAAVPVTVTVGSPVTTSTEQPRRVAMLVVDTSGSMAGTPLASVKSAAQTFLGQVPADVSVGLVSFSDTARVLVAPTKDRAVLKARVLGLQAGGGTALYDAMRLGLAGLGPSGERMLVVLSDGADTASRASLAMVTTALRHSGVRAALVGYNTDVQQTRTLSQLAGDVGGRLIPASDARSLVGAFSVAAATFASQVMVHGTLQDPLTPGSHFVAVTLSVGGGTVGASTSLTVAPPPVVATGSPAPAPPPTSRWTLTIGLAGGLLLLFLGLALLLTTVFMPGRRATASLRALDAYRLGVAGGAPLTDATADDNGSGLARTALDVSERFVARRGLTERIALRLERADLRIRPNEWVLLRTCIGLAVVAVATLLTGNLLIGLPVGVVLTWLGSHLYLVRRTRKRSEAFEEQLPDTLHLVASSIRTGFSLGQAVDGAAQGASDPIGSELTRALAETRIGEPLESALDRVADRVDSRDLHWTVMAVRIQQHTGGNLSEVLQTTSATIRERASMARRVKALSAEGRLSAYILIALPILLFAFLFLTRRPYVSLLWTTTPGLVMSAFGLLLLVAGWFWMRAMSKVEI